MIRQNKLRFLYDNLTESQRRDFFKPVQNGQIVMKSEKFTDPNTGEPTTVESYLDDVYNRFNDAFNSSNYKNGPIQLDKKQINHFVEQRRLDDIQKLGKARIKRSDDAWVEHIKADPESIKLYNDIDRLNTSPITVASPTSGDTVTITGKDIELYSKIAKEIKDNKETGAPKDPQYDTKAQEVEAQTLAKYGMNKDKYAAIPVYANNLTKAVDQSKEDRSKFLNDQVLTGSRLYRPQEVMLTSGKEEVNVDVIKQTQAILQAAKLLTNAPYKIASKILSPAGEKSAKENINIGYWMDENTNEYKLRIGNGAEHEDVPISPQQAIQMHLSTSNPYKEIEKKLDLNANGAGSSNTADPSGIMSYENADHKGYINGGNYEVRAHYEKDEHGYYVDVYTCNVHNPKEVTRVQMDPVATLGQAEDALNEWINKNKNKK